MRNKECCGTCEHCQYNRGCDEWECLNEDSENYGYLVDYKYHCEDWEERE